LGKGLRYDLADLAGFDGIHFLGRGLAGQGFQNRLVKGLLHRVFRPPRRNPCLRVFLEPNCLIETSGVQFIRKQLQPPVEGVPLRWRFALLSRPCKLNSFPGLDIGPHLRHFDGELGERF